MSDEDQELAFKEAGLSPEEVRVAVVMGDDV